MLYKIIVCALFFTSVSCDEPDPSGYLTYCPCMGRFGNQADHFLGALAFSKALNRTLIIPPWVEYRKGALKSNQVPFDTYFKVEPLQEYHRVILMHDFMTRFGDELWPIEKRVSFCYMERQSLNKENAAIKDCHAKDGNPFGPFWNTYNISFTRSEFFGPLHFDVHHSDVAQKWMTAYQAQDWPVLAFTGAPASFPVQNDNRFLHKYLIWNDTYQEKARNLISTLLPKGAFLGIHLRNGMDWVRACEHIKSSKQLFASPQCLGYNNEKGELYTELCMPSKEAIIKQIKRLVKMVRQQNKLNQIVSIYVASDSNHMITELNAGLARMNITAFKAKDDDPHLDLAVLGTANHFIGNCISSYTAFVKRERDAKGFPSYFWSYPKEKERTHRHEEL